MNKVAVIFIAVCIVNIHAFVKREAEPSTTENYLEQTKNKIEELSKQLTAKVSENFNPEQLKKGFNDVINQINNWLEPNKKKENNEQQA